MNQFRLAADSLHVMAIIILLVKLLKTRSAAGLSGKTQLLMTMVYVSRYLDLTTQFISYYNTIMKLFFISSSSLILYCVYVHFRDTYDYKRDSFKVEYLWTVAFVLALFVNHEMTPIEVLWTFSIFVESVAVLPQLFLLMKTTETETLIAYYLVAMGLYRALYIANWVFRYYTEHFYDTIAILAGVIQTIIYCFVFVRLSKMRKVSAGELMAHPSVYTLPALWPQPTVHEDKMPIEPPPYSP